MDSQTAPLQNPDLAAAIEQATSALQGKRLAEAERVLSAALQNHPDNLVAQGLLGVARMMQGRHADALRRFDNLLQQRPRNAWLHTNRALALTKMGRTQDALGAYDRALALQPDSPDALNGRGTLLMNAGKIAEGLVHFERTLAVKPDYIDALSNRGIALMKLGRLDEALAQLDRTLTLQPDHAGALNNRGCTLENLNRCDEAIACYDTVLASRPDFHEAWCNRGKALQKANREKEALASFDMALALAPDMAEAHLLRALSWLRLGELERGWHEYEWRWLGQELKRKKPRLAQPLWLGHRVPPGRTILLHAEQGLGDTLQFCRYVPEVARRFDRVIVQVQPPLVSLLASLMDLPGAEGSVQVIAKGSPLPAFDFHCPLLTLPLAFGTTLTNIPAPPAYLSVSEDKRRAWRERLESGDRQTGPSSAASRTARRIGLVWSGSPGHNNDVNRSIPLALLCQGLLEGLHDAGLHAGRPAGIELFSLQKEVRTDDQAALQHSRIRHMGDALRDFSDTAALADAMDLIISVDTATVHLAGALGKPVWILLPWSPDWRWLMQGDSSPWYPSARLFRQPGPGAWQPVFDAVRDAAFDAAFDALRVPR